MTLGKHRNVMIGDRGTRPLVSSTIQFVKPQILKADLNKQLREKFNGCRYCTTTTTVYSIVSQHRTYQSHDNHNDDNDCLLLLCLTVIDYLSCS